MEAVEAVVDLSSVEGYLISLYEQGERIEMLLAQNTELIAQIYTVCLYGVGVTGAILVCYILYRFLRQFF